VTFGLGNRCSILLSYGRFSDATVYYKTRRSDCQRLASTAADTSMHDGYINCVAVGKWRRGPSRQAPAYAFRWLRHTAHQATSLPMSPDVGVVVASELVPEGAGRAGLGFPRSDAIFFRKNGVCLATGAFGGLKNGFFLKKS
jgi:hypothetical protein